MKPEDYHWGYMTNNYFSPESSYALAPDKASGVRELQELVAAFHQARHSRHPRRRLAITWGEPAHLLFIDRPVIILSTILTGSSPIGAAAATTCVRPPRWPRASLSTAAGISSRPSGWTAFVLTLAELLGVDVLREIEAALKRVKPSVILIAEPWSFRGSHRRSAAGHRVGVLE